MIVIATMRIPMTCHLTGTRCTCGQVCIHIGASVDVIGNLGIPFQFRAIDTEVEVVGKRSS